ncbi:hypothetical protein BKI52_10945 [marine bacterium AO1-C]|nr:hypothetical protein BKI52_10945 [marine bacterium AO1-C]
MNRIYLLIPLFVFLGWPNANAQKNTDTRPLPNFTAFNFYGAAKIYLVQGNEEKIVLKTKRKLDVSEITTDVRQGKLYITSRRPKVLFNPRLKIYIHFKKLELIEIEGKARVYGQTAIKGEKLDLIVMGSSRTYLDVELNQFKTHLMGAGGINVKGKAKYQNLVVDGAGAIRAANLEGIEVRAQLNGAGNILTHAIGTLRAGISGVGQIRYRGNPVNTKFSTDGVGSIGPLE